MVNEIITKTAESKGLDIIYTGGGFDYVYRAIHKDDGSKIEIILSASDMDGSPETLEESCQIAVWFDDEWISGVTFEFDTVLKGMDFMLTDIFKTMNYFGDRF